MLSFHSEEYLTSLPDEEMVAWWGFLIETKHSAKERTVVRNQFATLGMSLNDARLDELLEDAKTIMRREFNRRSIPLPS